MWNKPSKESVIDRVQEDQTIKPWRDIKNKTDVLWYKACTEKIEERIEKYKTHCVL